MKKDNFDFENETPETAGKKSSDLDLGLDFDLSFLDDIDETVLEEPETKPEQNKPGKDDKFDKCEVVAYGLDNANGVKYLNGKLYLTQAFLYGVKRGDGAASSGLYMFSATDRNVKVGNTPADPQCVFSDVTRNPQIRGGLNGVAVDAKGFIYTGN